MDFSIYIEIIRKLRKKGLVFQKRNKDNNREYNLFLTDYGWSIYKAHAAVDEECGRRKLKQLSVFREEGVEKVEIIVKLKYEERAAVVNLWQLFLSFLYERPYKKNKFCINFYTKFGRLS